ncbi:MAG: molybdopterin-dependent oxidoreductase [Desulfobacterales bacterium]|nr:molybdopterin-dependent oxidoreductase [Desulfobacterales bacterium]
MGEWQTTGCVLCAQNCGLKVLVEDDKITRVKPDRENPRSKGYACRKGLKLPFHQYPADRITRPLKRVGDKFEAVSWDQALDEIAHKMKSVVKEHGPRSLAYMGGGSQGGHMETAFGVSLLRGMGSQYYYSSAGQEFSGHWWVTGRVMGRQYNISGPDEHNTEMLVAWGWNGMESHQMPRAPIALKEISKDPDRILVAVDPRKSETASIANIHLALRPGTDALLIKAMIAILLEKGCENETYLDDHVAGWDRVRPWFENFDAKGAVEVCGLEYDSVLEFCRLMATKRWSFHQDLGIYMGRHSTLNSYLLYILGAVCGVFQTPGGNLIPGMVMPMGFNADERNPKVWRTIATDMPPAAAGSFPPAVMPEEILSDHPERLRAVYVSACNPLRSYPDTTAYEKAFSSLDLLVVNDIVMSETARLAHYVLPCRSFYEAWDTTFFPWTYPEIYMQLRRPVVPVPGECLEAAQIHTELAGRLGLVPDIPDSLYEAAKGDRLAFGGELMTWASEEPRAFKAMPFVLAKTLGAEWDSAAKAALWGLLMTAPEKFRNNAARAGFEPDFLQGDKIFQALTETPQGLWVGKVDTGNPMADIKTESGRLEIYIPELADQARDLNPEDEARDLKMPEEFPLVLNAGRHTRFTMNSLMRNPEWNNGKRDCTIAVNPDDAEAMGLEDGQTAKITTAAGSETGEIQVSGQVGQGMVLIPHGFGLNYQGRVHGINVNRLTLNTHRDPIGTPLHRFVPCRVEAVVP